MKVNTSKSLKRFTHNISGENGQMALLKKKKKKIQYFAQFPKLIREMPLFWNSIFSKSSLKKKNLESYNGVLRTYSSIL